MQDRDKSLLFRSVSIRTILPNVVTLLAFMSGLTAIRFALSERWELAVGATIIAGVFDGLDGTVARLLKSTSRFGAELDSLSDIVAFGVAPAVVIYLWALEKLDRLGWAVALVFAIAMALRLARFNARLDKVDEPVKRIGFLTGVPAPAGASLMLVPMMIDFSRLPVTPREYPVFVALYTVTIAFLMISTLPTFSLKAIRIRREIFTPAMLLIGVVIAGLFVQTWSVLLILGVLYLGSLPISYITYARRVSKKVRNK